MQRALYYYNITLTPNEKFVNESVLNIRCTTHTREKPCIYAPAVRLILIQEIKRLYVQIKAIDFNSKRVIMEQMFSMCTFEKQVFDVLIKVIFDILVNHINFKLSCPFKKVRKVL